MLSPVGAAAGAATPDAAAAVLWLLVALPAAVGAVLALAAADLAGLRSRDLAEKVAAPAGVLAAAAALVLAVVAALQRPAVEVAFLLGAPVGLGVDGLSAVVVPAVAAVVLLVLVFSAADVRESRARFTGLMLLFAAAVSMTATATTLPALLLAWEVMGAASFALIGFWWREDDRVSAGMTAFVTTRAADLGLYLAVGAAYAGGAGLRLADLGAAAGPWQDVVAAGLLVAALGKAAQLPFSWWLSRAMQGPSPVSALLHSAAMVAMGGYLLLRVEPLLAASGWAADAAAWVGVLTAVVLGVVAVAQRDLKQLLAASTASQLGFVVLAAGVGAVTGGTAQLLAHAATKALLFLVAGAWLTALGTKALPALRGVAWRWPVVGVAAVTGLLALAGLPPLSLWATKDAVLTVAREQSLALYLVGLLAAALSAAYAGKALVLVVRRVPDHEQRDVEAGWDTEEEGTRQVPAIAQAPLAVLAVASLALVVLGLPPVEEVLAETVAAEPPAGASLLELVVSAVVALAALVAVAVLVLRGRAPQPAWARGWVGLGTATQRLVVRPVLALAQGAAHADDGLDALVRGLARSTVRAAEVARAGDRGIDSAVHAVAAGARRLGDLARRPQTGQLHTYYAQAVGVLAVGSIGLVLLVVVR